MSPAEQNNDSVTYVFNVEGMQCAPCRVTVESLLEHAGFTQSATVDYFKKKATVTVNKGTKPSQVIQYMDSLEAGFSLSYLPAGMEHTFHFTLAGDMTNRDFETLRAHFEKQVLVKDMSVNFSTKALSITCPVNLSDESIKSMQADIAREVEDLFDKKRDIKAVPFELPQHKNQWYGLVEKYRKHFLINLVMAIPLYWLSGFIPLPITIVGQLLGIGLGLVTLTVMVLTGREFYQGAWQAFTRRGTFDMNSLIALGTGSAWVYSMILALLPHFFPISILHYQFLAVNMILGIVNIGKAVRASAQEDADKKVRTLEEVFISQQPQLVKRVKHYSKRLHRITDLSDALETVHYKDIKEKQVIVVEPGERFPVEGSILNDISINVDQAAITGESKPCTKKRGDEVFSGSLNMSNQRAFIRAKADGDKGYLTKVIEDVQRSYGQKTSISRLVDKVAKWFAPSIIALASLTGIAWATLGPAPVFPYVFKTVMAVLLYACPCALGLATPISIAIGLAKMTTRGMWVHDPLSVERLAKANTVVFDKTGTLTELSHSETYRPYSNFTEEQLLELVASLEQKFDHPIAKCLVKDSSLKPCTHFEKADQGVMGVVDKWRIHMGSAAQLASWQIDIPENFTKKEAELAKAGKSSVYVAINNQCYALLGLKHHVREDAAKMVADLQNQLGIQCFMATGDTNKEVALDVAQKIGIPQGRVHAGLDSTQKKELIERLRRNHRYVVMVGDGVNDLEANKAANVAVALGPWTSASANAHVALQKLNLASLIVLARATMRNIHQNLLLAGIYNILGLVAATGMLYPLFGFTLNPVLASISMGMSSLCVVWNSSRLDNILTAAINKIEELEDAQKPGYHWFGLGYLYSMYTVLNQYVNKKRTQEPPSPEKDKRRRNEELFFDAESGEFGRKVNGRFMPVKVRLMGASPQPQNEHRGPVPIGQREPLAPFDSIQSEPLVHSDPLVYSEPREQSIIHSPVPRRVMPRQNLTELLRNPPQDILRPRAMI